MEDIFGFTQEQLEAMTPEERFAAMPPVMEMFKEAVNSQYVDYPEQKELLLDVVDSIHKQSLVSVYGPLMLTTNADHLRAALSHIIQASAHMTVFSAVNQSWCPAFDALELATSSLAALIVEREAN